MIISLSVDPHVRSGEYWSIISHGLLTMQTSLQYSNPPLIRQPPLQWNSCFIRGVTSLEGGNLVVFYYFSVSKIWHDKMDGRSPIREGPTVHVYHLIYVSQDLIFF